jgi:hypothetical protein
MPPAHNRLINEALHGVKELPPNRRTSSSIDRCRLRNLQREGHRTPIRFELQRRGPQSSSGNIKILSTSDTYPQSWTTDRKSQPCAVSQMSNAHNHCDASPGIAVKYGNGDLETIERLVDIRHYEVQVTPDNCAATLISVDQIVEDEYTVIF